MPQETTETELAAKRFIRRAIRVIGPLIPLAIALVYALLIHQTVVVVLPAPPPTQVPVTPTGLPGSVSGMKCGGGTADSPPCKAPYPMLSKGHPVDWWFVFKLNASKFPGCGGGDTRICPFGGEPQNYSLPFGQRYAYASSDANALQDGGKSCLGTTTDDPIGATFDQVYNGGFHYVIWNDQFKGDPAVKACSTGDCGAPWGHSKGLVAWNDDGVGLVMQVTTPSWPGAGSAKFPRKTDGNTLGCVRDDNVEFSQHFFALRLSKADLILVLQALQHASVVTDPKNPQIASQSPTDVQSLVDKLGQESKDTGVTLSALSSKVQLISKPSSMAVPPWQMVSSVLGGVSLRTATWWDRSLDPIYSSNANTVPGCWDASLHTNPGAIEIAATGIWDGTVIGLEAGPSPNANHAKVGVSTSGDKHYVIFGDMNQQGVYTGADCKKAQNPRGGMFFVMENAGLWKSMTSLLNGTTEPTTAPVN
jgi:hypothetical protein